MPIDEDLRTLLDAQYVRDLAGRDVDELRAMRTECQHVEAKLSYLRRLDSLLVLGPIWAWCAAAFLR